jgi:hypothetical protein
VRAAAVATIGATVVEGDDGRRNPHRDVHA